ncbi:polyphenol oxidase, chloroplastic [Iris pallida]|uniref:Polyphenol oxidase, chloroplastic n=1 Tax=Iris pallida TaxID=29817 RepID=A0AAX6IBA4_IRIPA|nr:polyphenol oxidase, chloroplastic [Iris pallida]
MPFCVVADRRHSAQSIPRVELLSSVAGLRRADHKGLSAPDPVGGVAHPRPQACASCGAGQGVPGQIQQGGVDNEAASPRPPPQLAPPVPNTLHLLQRRLQSSRRRRRRPFHDPRELALLPVPPILRLLPRAHTGEAHRRRRLRAPVLELRLPRRDADPGHLHGGTTERREAECPPPAARACSHRHHSRESRRGLRRTRRRRADRHQPGPAVPAHGLGRVQAGALHGLQAPARGRRGVLRDGDDRNGAPQQLAPVGRQHGLAGVFRVSFPSMGTIYAAARDPVFYAHHTNIDRLWELWRRLHGYRGSRPEFDDPLWLDSHFYFYDENADLVRVRVRDAIDMDRLGYAYEEVDLPWLDARPKPSVAPELARSLLRAKEKDYDNMLRMATNKGPWTLEETVRVQVARPVPKSTIKAGQEEFEEEVLVVEGISVEKGMHAKFDIYVNLVVDETAASPKLREYAGFFVKMKGADVAMKGGSIRNMKVGISEILEDLEAEGDESIWVSLVPRGGTGNATRVDGIRVEYMQ